MNKPGTVGGYKDEVTRNCERVLVTLLRGLGPWKNSVYLVGGLTPRYLFLSSALSIAAKWRATRRMVRSQLRNSSYPTMRKSGKGGFCASAMSAIWSRDSCIAQESEYCARKGVSRKKFLFDSAYSYSISFIFVRFYVLIAQKGGQGLDNRTPNDLFFRCAMQAACRSGVTRCDSTFKITKETVRFLRTVSAVVFHTLQGVVDERYHTKWPYDPPFFG